MPLKRVLIIGGAGFIGSHLVDVCLQNGNEVWVFDNFSTGKREFIRSMHTSNIIPGDILDADALNRAIQHALPEVVFHLAAIHHIPTCEQNSDKALQVNIIGSNHVLNACCANLVKRFVFASTGAIYDPLITSSLSEETTIKAVDVYGISKHACENLVEYYVIKKGIQGVVARLFNTVGRRETNSHVVPAIFNQLVNGNRQVRLGNLTPRRDYIHVEDVANALFALGNLSLPQPFQVFNVGSGKDYSVQELVELCADVIGEPIEVISAHDLQRKIDRPMQLADASRLRQMAGWIPQRSLKEALCEIWRETQKEFAA